MSDVDDLVDDLAEDDDDSPTAAQQDSSVITGLRKKLREAQKNAKEWETKATAAEPYREKYLKRVIPEIAKEAGGEAFATFYAKDLGDNEASVEHFKTWAAENQVQLTETAQPVTQGSEGTFAPTVGGQVPGPQLVPASQIDQMMRDPARQAEAIGLIRAGRVEYTSPEAAAQAAALRR